MSIYECDEVGGISRSSIQIQRERDNVSLERLLFEK